MGKMVAIAEKIYTNRLLLKKIAEEDLDTLLHWSNSAEAYGRYLSPEQMNKDELRQRYESGIYWNPAEKLFLIQKKDSIPIGTIHYWLPSDKLGTAIVAIKIAEPDQRNQGFGTEAQKSLLIFLFDKVKINNVDMYTDLDNLAQQRCLKKLGFKLLETVTYDDCGIRRTGNHYRITSDQYQLQPIFRFHYE